MMYDAPNYKIINKRCVELLDEWVTPYGTVPKGFRGNGASVPKGFRWFAKPLGDLLYASIFHDYYYRQAIRTKKYADKSFRKIALDFGVNKFKANVAYIAVKLFGKGGY